MKHKRKFGKQNHPDFYYPGTNILLYLLSFFQLPTLVQIILHILYIYVYYFGQNYTMYIILGPDNHEHFHVAAQVLMVTSGLMNGGTGIYQPPPLGQSIWLTCQYRQHSCMHMTSFLFLERFSDIGNLRSNIVSIFLALDM